MAHVVSTADPAALERAVAALRAGQVVVIPTDTVYGVAVDPFVEGATERLFDAKRRPRDVPLPVLVGDPSDVERLAVMTDLARRLTDEHWPGGLTVVLDRKPGLTADLGLVEDTVGIRCPDHDFTRALCRAAGPLAVTSANLHGEPTPADAGAVADVFGDSVALVVDDGVCAGEPSTVVDCRGERPVVLRAGTLDASLLGS